MESNYYYYFFFNSGDKKNNNNKNVIKDKVLIVANDYDLYSLDLNNNEFHKSTILKTTKGILNFDHYNENITLWIEIDSYNVSLRFFNCKNITQSSNWRPISVAFDFITQKVYVVDAQGRKLDVYDPYVGKFGIVWSDLIEPTDVVLDPDRGLVFLLQKSNSVTIFFYF